MQNGLAIGGDYMSAASFLGIAGTIALNGYDGFLYSIGFLVAWLVALLLVAELMRNTGKFTMADVLSFRMRQAPVRTAAAISTVVVSIFYLLAQMVGAGSLVAAAARPVAHQHHREEPGDRPGRRADDHLRRVRRNEGHHLGADRQGRPADARRRGHDDLGAGQVRLQHLLAAGRARTTSTLRSRQRREASSHRATSTARPGHLISKLDFISLGLALVLGTAGLPHVLIRFYTVPDSKTARKSVNWAIGLIGIFYLMTLVIGFGAAALVGTQKVITDAERGRQHRRPAAGRGAGGGRLGAVMLAIIAAVAFATILAVVAGLTLASSSSLAHDVYANVIKQGQGDRRARRSGSVGSPRWSSARCRSPWPSRRRS